MSGSSSSIWKRPVLILGRLDDIMTGVRQLKRTEPLETIEMVLEAKGNESSSPLPQRSCVSGASWRWSGMLRGITGTSRH